MREQFPLFQTAIDLAHTYWKRHISEGDIVIDATCGNGNDALFLAQSALTASRGELHIFDIQKKALDTAQEKLLKLHPAFFSRIHFHHQCHSTIASYAVKDSVGLIVYNLGYLPSGDKAITTRKETTLQSVEVGLTLLRPGGIISITCYPGHPEGKMEEDLLVDRAKTLPQSLWSVCWHRWLNRNASPSLILIQKVRNQP